jgi:hypothetical protein
MKTLKTKVILSAVVLLFALVATIGSTFAWFTVSDTVTVQPMQLSVNAEDSILIRLATPSGAITTEDLFDASQYKTTLTNADIEAYYEDFLTYKLSPVTAVQPGYGSVNPKLLSTLENVATNFARALTTVVGSETTLENNATTGRYIELNFYLYSQSSEEVDIAVQNVNVNVTGITGNSTAQNAVENAVRVGVWRAGYFTTSFQPESLPGYIFGDSIDYAFQFQSGLPGYFTTAPVYTDNIADGFNRINDYSDLTTTLETTLAANHNPSTVVFTLDTEVPTMVSVRIYIEGWDAQASNAIIAAKFNVSFQFAII